MRRYKILIFICAALLAGGIWADGDKEKRKLDRFQATRKVDLNRIKSPQRRRFFLVRKRLADLGFIYLKMRYVKPQEGRFLVVVYGFKEPDPSAGIRLKGDFKRFRMTVRLDGSKVVLDRQILEKMGYIIGKELAADRYTVVER